MRAIHLSDLNLAARTLMVAHSCERLKFLFSLFENTNAADKYRKHTGLAHPQFGNGSLGAACQNYPKAPMPDRCQPQYLDCLRVVIEGLLTSETDDVL